MDKPVRHPSQLQWNEVPEPYRSTLFHLTVRGFPHDRDRLDLALYPPGEVVVAINARCSEALGSNFRGFIAAELDRLANEQLAGMEATNERHWHSRWECPFDNRVGATYTFPLWEMRRLQIGGYPPRVKELAAQAREVLTDPLSQRWLTLWLSQGDRLYAYGRKGEFVAAGHASQLRAWLEAAARDERTEAAGWGAQAVLGLPLCPGCGEPDASREAGKFNFPTACAACTAQAETTHPGQSWCTVCQCWADFDPEEGVPTCDCS